jgi:hypothetical protein
MPPERKSTLLYVLFGFLFDPENGSITFLRSVGEVPPDCGVIPQKEVLW